MNRLKFHDFTAQDQPLATTKGRQALYLRHYLGDLDATTVIEEPAYFDRDYLAEFAAFYGVSARGYSNRCRRCHFFSGKGVNRSLVKAALGGSRRALARLQDQYLGFAVIRPIPAAPLGRTVLKWYPDRPAPSPPRVTEPKRAYACHLAGITLTVEGLAWQQQDTGVGACATVAVWSALHSSAFDDHHAIPTTADITRYAHRTASLGARIFPSNGLSIFQLCEAIKEAGLAPVVLQGDAVRPLPNGAQAEAFSPDRFTSACASLIRSGYPVIVVGELEGDGKHAVCTVGFREVIPSNPGPGKVELQDAGIEHLYHHDDNIGPSVRVKVERVAANPGQNTTEYVRLVPEAPPRRHAASLPDPTQGYKKLIPTQIVAAVHEDLRTSPDRLLEKALVLTTQVMATVNALRKAGIVQLPGDIGLTVGTRFMKVHKYMDDEVGRVLAGTAVLGRVRLDILEKIGPMSLHIGIVRIGWGGVPLLDLLFDTTDSDRNMTAWGHVAYDPFFAAVVDVMRQSGKLEPGPLVPAY